MRYYKSNMTEKTLSVSISSSALQITLSDTLNFPSYPFTLVIDPDLASEEIVTATSLVSGNTINVTRGEDGSSAQAHSAAAKVKHMVTARDLQDAQDHIAATTGHGATGAVVGTTNSQVLTNKTISGATNTLSSIPNSALTNSSVTIGATAVALGATASTITGVTLTDYDLKINYASPIGHIVAYAGTSAPPSWLLCDGSTFSSSTYPGLAAILGDRYGTHSGTTYYLPDFRSKFLRGSAATGSISGTSGGTATHTHTGTTGAPSATSLSATSGSSASEPTTTHTHSFTSDATSTLPPYFDINWLIKATA